LKIITETQRLLIRELTDADLPDFFKLDSNPLVYEYLGYSPGTSMHEASLALNHILAQYQHFGVGRWAVILKSTQALIGLCGIQFWDEEENNHIHFYDIGYRFFPEYWGHGFATEAAKATVEYAFSLPNITKLVGMVHVNNPNSLDVAGKCGLKTQEIYCWQNQPFHWMTIHKP